MKHVLLFASVLTFALIVAGLPGPAHAHRPTFGETVWVKLGDGSAVTVQLLFGDGIIGSDPVQAVIVDGDNQVIAETPVSELLYIDCPDAAQNIAACRIFDPLNWFVYVPQEDEFTPIAPIENQWPSFYPNAEFSSGFRRQPASIGDAIMFEVRQVLSNPPAQIGLFALVVWCSGVWMIFLWLLRWPQSQSVGDLISWFVFSIWKLILIAVLCFQVLLIFLVVMPFSPMGLALALTASGMIVISLRFALLRSPSDPVAKASKS